MENEAKICLQNGPMAPNVQYVPVQNGHVDGLTPTAVPTGSLAHSPPPYFSSIPALHTDPHHVCQLHISQEGKSIKIFHFLNVNNFLF